MMGKILDQFMRYQFLIKYTLNKRILRCFRYTCARIVVDSRDDKSDCKSKVSLKDKIFQQEILQKLKEGSVRILLIRTAKVSSGRIR